ncbi:MAG: acetyl-CoA C-acyltransferase [Flavobacteriales bacterium]|nr:acetyl-CoA C-acyltransferase [Bacteroidota bacterium]MCB9239981.1 acetyl-CoA C-acyltransferase [Flavobacteriales bacterium]
MNNAYVIDAVRTPVGRFGGTLASVRPDDLAAHVIKTLIERNPNLDLTRIEDVIFGAANQAGEDNRNVARMALLMAGIPVEVPGVTVNRLCASGLQSISDAAKGIMCGMGDAFVAGGVESMTRAPFVMAKAESAYSRTPEIYDTSIGWRFTNPKLAEAYYPFAMGETAENVAERFQVTRLQQDEFSHQTQLKYQAAHEAGRFANELAPVIIPQRKGDAIVFDKDEHPRLSSVEKLGTLKPAFRANGTVTAGNSSGINDGAAALLIVGEQAVKDMNLKPMARVVSMAATGVHPDIMGIGPVSATRKALQRAGLNTSDIGLFELNEAFAAQAIACMNEMDLDPNIVNVNGGSIAIGHPLGASGARIATTLLHEMQKREVRYGVATMCVGVGQGKAVIFERC